MVRLLVALAALLLLVPEVPAQGKLERARAETYGSPSSPPESPSDDRPLTDDGTDELLSEVFGPFFLATVAAPFVVPQQLFETITLEPSFPAHPYADVAGYLSPADRPGKAWGLRVAVEDGNDFSGLNRLGVRAWLDTGSRWGVTTNWDHYVERLDCGCIDEFTLGDLMLTYRFVQSERVQMHAGVGGRGLFDRYRTRGGFNVLYSADVFPAKPLVLSAQAELGHLNDAFTTRLRGSVGVQLRHAELFVGYDWLRIGGVDLHGPMAGLRLWF
jgi:hypothetical protein